MKNLSQYSNIYFIGVGGIGMSALARYFKFQGKKVFGYDKTTTSLTEKLEKEGVEITFSDSITESIQSFSPEDTLIIYTPAIKDSVILSYFQERSFTIRKRSEILGEITKNTHGIAIAGTHGKTTTSALVAHLMKECGFKFSAFLGGIAENFGSNFLYTGDEYAVMEADEFDRSFLHLRPEYGIITSTDADHLDIYGTEEDIKEGFKAFGELVPAQHLLARRGIGIDRAGATYAVNDSKADFYSDNLALDGDKIRFDYHFEGNKEVFSWHIPGVHNVENATAAISLLLKLGAPLDAVKKALLSFKGIKRRYTKHIFGDKIYIDDYAHHPTELKAVIDSIRTFYPEKKLLVVFQPHLFSRTKDFLQGFAEVLSEADELIILDIYPAREKQEDFPGVSSDDLASHCSNSVTVRPLDGALEEISHKEFDILLTAGAGNIDLLYEPLVKKFSAE